MKKEKTYNPPLIDESFNKIDLGLLMINTEPREIIYSNRYFKKIARGKEEVIYDSLFKNLENASMNSYFRCDMKIEADFVVGYTIYKLSGTSYVVFINDISHKRIYFENKGENRFYDRLSSLIAEVAHELGNPLASMNTTLQVLNECMEAWDIQKQKEYLQRAMSDIDRLSRYLDLMRNFSRIDISDCRPILLEPLIQRVISQMNPTITKKNISVSCRIDKDQQVIVDEMSFYLVLLNLFLNSEENLTDPGKISLEVEEVNEYYVKLAYQNNGPPIPDHLREKVFLPFFTTSKKNPGIGLAASLKLMTRMGGTLKIETPVIGWGVRFVLHIPVKNENIERHPFDKIF
ncbi:MAG: HAMP domain-containing histidine kinase [bacterium]|nr:HAMP domain-containing histidine kinase [bacterium]